VRAEDFVSGLAKVVGDHLLPEEVDLRIEFDRGKYRALADNPAGDRLSPLEPDMVGEYLVLKEGQKERKRKVMERLWELGWEIRPFGVFWFVTLLYKDFTEDIDFEQIRPKRIDKRNALAWAMTLYNIATIFGKKGQTDEAAGYWERIEGLRGEGFAGDREITLELAKGAFNLANDYGRAGKLEKAVYYWERIEGLRGEGFAGDREMALAWAKGAVNLTYYYGKAGELKKAVESFERIERLRGEGFAGDREMALELAKGAVLCAILFKRKGDAEKAGEYRGRFEAVWEGYRGDEEFEELGRMLREEGLI